MLNESKKLFAQLGISLDDGDEFEELVFEEEELTKEQCFDLCRKTLFLLQKVGNRPYMLFRFKEQCNEIAKKKGGWKEYYSLCAKYIEFYVYKDFSYNQFKRKYIGV